MVSQFSVDIQNPMFNKYFIGFLFFSLLSFGYWIYLKRKESKDLLGSRRIHNIVLLFLGGPLIYLSVTEIYSLILVYFIILLTI